MPGLRSSMSLFLTVCVINVFGQSSYKDSLQTYLDHYVKDHEVIHGADRKYFRFYPVNESYRVTASFEKANENKWFSMETSGLQKKNVQGLWHNFVYHS
jgi:hypothetical protein